MIKSKVEDPKKEDVDDEISGIFKDTLGATWTTKGSIMMFLLILYI